MEYRIDSSGGSHLVGCSGRLTFADANAFHLIADAIAGDAGAGQPGNSWVFDFASLEFIDSAGLGMLLMARDLVEKKGGRLSIRHASGQVRKALDLARFGELMAIEA